jgi:sugar phosphate isomerase/epimerase
MRPFETSLSRRSFLASAAATVRTLPAAAGRVPIAVQLYSVRKDCEQDLPAVLSAIAKMGYQGVEFAGYYGRGAKELRKMLDDLNLKTCSTHISIDTLKGDKLEPSIEFNQILGNPRLTVSWLNPTKTIKPWYEAADSFNEIGEKLRPHKMRVGFHNHPHELVAVEGEMPLNVILDHTGKDVIMQLDLGSIMKSGGDPVAYLKRYPGRAVTMHVKDYAPDNNKALLGEGIMDLKTVFATAESIGGIEWYIIEQETYPDGVTPMESVDRCLKTMRKMGK